MCMSIGFILSGCNQSLTDLSKYPPIDNSDEKYLYNRFKDKKHDIIYHTFVSYCGINRPFKIRINYGNK